MVCVRDDESITYIGLANGLREDVSAVYGFIRCGFDIDLRGSRRSSFDLWATSFSHPEEWCFLGRIQRHEEIRGWIDRITDRGVLKGWALYGDGEESSPLKIEIFRAEEALGETVTNVERRDVAEALGITQAACGFQFELSWRQLILGTGTISAYASRNEIRSKLNGDISLPLVPEQLESDNAASGAE